ncbi:MAG: glycerate kinase [bacterium]|nr:glycerate kinase [bacterium]
MKIVIATDSFKGTLSAIEAGQAIAAGIEQVLPDADVVVLPVADGGEGTAEVLHLACGGRWAIAEVIGPLGDPIGARFAILPDAGTAVLDMAAASGLPLLTPDRYDPLLATTYGTGQLIGAALDRGCRRLLIGVGGSATVDGGCGAAQALGVQFDEADGRTLRAPLGGGDLNRIARIDLSARDARLTDCAVSVLCDVTNPLCGPMGAALIFGPQKGATEADVVALERNLTHLAHRIQADLRCDVHNLPGGGAAGGLAAGLHAFVGAELVSGAPAVLEAVGLQRHLQGADLVVTGEGRLDDQSFMGKVVGAVAAQANAAGVPVIAIAGSVNRKVTMGTTLEAAYAVTEEPHRPPPDRSQAADLLTHRTAEVFTHRGDSPS